MKNIDIEELIRSKKFEDLTSSELQLVKELTANEEEFIQMKQFLLSMAAVTQTSAINPSVKGNLDAIFNSKFQLPHTEKVYTSSVPKIIPFYNTLWFRAAAIFIIGLGVAAPLIMDTNSLESKNTSMAKLERSVDNDASRLNTKVTENTSQIENKKVKKEQLTDKNISAETEENSINSSLSSTIASNISTSTIKTNTRSRKIDEMKGLPMYKRKNKNGPFVYSTSSPGMTGLVASTVPSTTVVSSGIDLKDFELTKQPETTDQMLDIIQAVY